jgi:hypothetical protein
VRSGSSLAVSVGMCQSPTRTDYLMAILTSSLSAFSTLVFFVLRTLLTGDTWSSPDDWEVLTSVGWTFGVISDSLSDEEEEGDQDSCAGNGAAAFCNLD